MSTFLRFKSSTGRKALTPHTYKKRQSLSPALDVAYCPEDIHHVKTDIVFVGGIHASDQLSDSWFDRQSNVDWPSELLPRDVPDARVLVYHYNPNTEEFYNAAAERNLEWHSRKLLFDLARIRADTHTEDRNIIFVAQSAGGLIVQRAIGFAKDSALPQVEELTCGIMFFGTPHLGSDLASWASLGSRLARLGGLNENRLINEIMSTSGFLDRVSSDFHSVLRSRSKSDPGINIANFYEELPIPGIGLVVARHNATLPGYMSYGIHATHANIAKFSSKDDEGYRMVIRSIRRWIQSSSLQDTELKRLPLIRNGYEKAREDCIRSLYFDEILFRQHRIQDPSPGTSEWIFDEPGLDFTKWLIEGGEPIWIYGAPGSGKSTMMKFLATSRRITDLLGNQSTGNHLLAAEPVFSVAHFFDSRGMMLERSLIGMLRSIIWQIFRQQPTAFDCTLPLLETKMWNTSQGSWKVSELYEVLRSILRLDMLQPVCIFIDALDELEDQGQFKFANKNPAHLFTELATTMSGKFRLILSSRQPRHLSSAFSLHRQINLSEHTLNDIRTIVVKNLLQFSDIPDESLVNSIVEKANGNLVWVSLACSSLIQGWAEGDTRGALESRLERIPLDLSNIYENIIGAIDPTDDSEYVQMMAIVLCAARPLSVRELCIVFDTCNPASSITKTVSIDQKKRLERKLFDWSKGYLCVQNGLVMFSHVSVHQFVMAKFSMSKLGHASPDGDMIILRACLLYIQESQVELEQHCLDFDSEFLDAGNAVFKDLPFFSYAVTYWVLHGIRLQKRVESHAFEMAIQQMQITQFATWKYYFFSIRESSEGNLAQQEVESYFLAKYPAVATPIELVSEINTQMQGPKDIEGASFSDSGYDSGSNLGTRSETRERVKIELDQDLTELEAEPLASEDVVAVWLNKLDVKSVEDDFSPDLTEQESALGLDVSGVSELRELVLAIFLNDDVLRPIYKTALETVSSERFERNFRRILKLFAHDLKGEANGARESDTANFCRSNARYIARYITNLFAKESSVRDSEIRQLQRKLPETRRDLLPILSALWSVQGSVDETNILQSLERFVSNSKAFSALQENTKKYVTPTSLNDSLARYEQVKLAAQASGHPPGPEEAMVFPHPEKNFLQLSESSQSVENLASLPAAKPPTPIMDSTLFHSLRPSLTFINSMLLHAYIYIQDQLSGFLEGLNLYERPLSPSNVRLRWTCGCGYAFFQDFSSSELSSACDLQDSLLNSGYQATLFMNPSGSQATTQASEAEGASLAFSSNNNETEPGPSSGRQAGRGDQVPGNSNSRRIIATNDTSLPSRNPSLSLEGKAVTPGDPAEVPECGHTTNAMWIILCFYHSQHVSEAVHLDIKEDDDDVRLMKLARQKYLETRGWWANYMAWKAVTKISFVKFQYMLDPFVAEGRAVVHRDWVPPESWKDGHFWKPCPAEPRPELQEWLLHLWSRPHSSRIYLNTQVTKLRLLRGAKRLQMKWRTWRSDLRRWLRQSLDQYRRFRGWDTTNNQLPFSNLIELQRLENQGHSAQDGECLKQTFLVRSTPKRLVQLLKAHPDEPPLGWGLHFEESNALPAPLKFMGIWVASMVMLSAVVYALILVHEKGVAYFGAGGFGIAIAGFLLTLALKWI